MLVACWSPKGGVGTTVVATALALVLAADRAGGEVLLADLGGDVPAALGLPDTDAAGISDWLAAAPDVPPDALARIEETAAPGVALLRCGAGALRAGGGHLLASVLTADPRRVVVDCGRLRGPDDEVATAVAAAADRSLLVLRPCYLAVHRAAVASPLRASGVVLVEEPGRSLGAVDVEGALGVPVVARVRCTEQVARTVDAGLLRGRLPRSLSEDVRGAA